MINIESNTYNNVELLEDVPVGTKLEYHQLSSGIYNAKIIDIFFNDANIGLRYTNTGLLSVGVTPKDRALFILVANSGSGENTLNNKRISKDTFLALRDNTELIHYCAPHSEYIYLNISKVLIDGLGFFDHPDLGYYIDDEATSSSSIRSLIYSLESLNVKQLSQIDSERVCQQFLMKYLSVFGKGKKYTKLSKSAYRDIAITMYDYVKAHSNYAIRLQDLCKATGKNERLLQRAFKSTFNITLQQFIKIHRLKQARKSLLGNEENLNVTDVAFKFGFTHMSRFTQEYKAMFRELPSETKAM